MKKYIFILLCACITHWAVAQEHKETITKAFSFPSTHVLQVYNINGYIQVEGYTGDKVLLEVEKIVKARSNEYLEKAKTEVKLGVEQTGDSLVLYMDNPYVFWKNGRYGRYNDNGYLKQDHDYLWKQDYDYIFNFKLKVPQQATVVLSTINKGDVTVNNMKGTVYANNINGSIILNKIAGQTKANTINGKVTATYTAAPTQYSSYKTLNGDIDISYPPDLSADIRFKNNNGEAYTDFTVVERLPGKIEKTSNDSEKGTTYKIEKHSAIRIGKGGPQLDFETFNGDITVRQLK